MNLSKSTSYTLLHVLNGCSTAAEAGERMQNIDIRSIQRALVRLTELGLLTRVGSINNPTYNVNYPVIVSSRIADKLLEDENRPVTNLHHQFLSWLGELPVDQIDKLFGKDFKFKSASSEKMSAKDLEHLTIELSWKSSALEGNTYTLLDTQLLLVEGIKAKNKTEFETQMIFNHKDVVAFVIENTDLFTHNIAYSSVEEIHRIISKNLGIETGIRKKVVKISASNYEPTGNPHQLRESMDDVLGVISRTQDPFVKALLALTLIPYLQAFEDGNKRTGRMLANAILISSINRGFSLRKTDARRLALAYLSFYEFNSILGLSDILAAELS